MSTGKNNISQRILVAPLDWGLGHATRCIPLIRRLLAEGWTVQLGGSGASGHLLRSEFPQLPYSEIPSHTIRYARSGPGLFWSLLKQGPALIKQLRAERQWLHRYLQQNPVDQILSDNRYGLHHPTTQNILLTHQLGLRSGISPWMDRILQGLLIRLLKNFQEVWVPDQENEPNLSGELGHPKFRLRVRLKYIGTLSRFQPTDRASIPNKITVVLSGPEPQRTLLEKKCISELYGWNGPVTIVRGLPNGGNALQAPIHWKISDHLSIDELQQEIEEADWVIARCGYSTIMDLAVLNKRAILIPTPGQPEQTYLAKWSASRNWWHCIDQHSDLIAALTRSVSLLDTNDTFAAP